MRDAHSSPERGDKPEIASLVRLEGLRSDTFGHGACCLLIFSDRPQDHHFADDPRLCRVASPAGRGRLPLVQGWAPSPDGHGETARAVEAPFQPEACGQRMAGADERETDEQMQIRPHEASDRARHVVATRRARRAWLEAGAFAIALAVTATSAVWAKRGAIGFNAPALAAIEQVSTHHAPQHHTQPAREAAGVHAAPAPEFTVDEIVEIDPADAEIRYFDNRPVRPVRVIWMVTTAYSPDERSCGKWADGITASNRSVWTNGMKLVAADTTVLRMHSLVSIPGYHDAEIVPVLDRGGAIKGNKLDLLYPTHERALQWGRQRLPVTVYEYAD